MIYTEINGIPIDVYFRCLNAKGFNKERAINYTKEIYNIDITETFNDKYKYIFYFFSDIFDKFYDNIEFKKGDTTRKYFNNVAKNKYYKFALEYNERGAKYDFFIPIQLLISGDEKANKFFETSVIHHIHPLMYKGTNDIENLINVNDFNHNLLHMNPLEEYKIYCHQAVDYLFYLWDYNTGLKYIYENYIINCNDKIKHKIIKLAFETEMQTFYKRLEDNLNNGQSCSNSILMG